MVVNTAILQFSERLWQNCVHFQQNSACRIDLVAPSALRSRLPFAAKSGIVKAAPCKSGRFSVPLRRLPLPAMRRPPPAHSSTFRSPPRVPTEPESGVPAPFSARRPLQRPWHPWWCERSPPPEMFFLSWAHPLPPADEAARTNRTPPSLLSRLDDLGRAADRLHNLIHIGDRADCQLVLQAVEVQTGSAGHDVHALRFHLLQILQ